MNQLNKKNLISQKTNNNHPHKHITIFHSGNIMLAVSCCWKTFFQQRQEGYPELMGRLLELNAD